MTLYYKESETAVEIGDICKRVSNGARHQVVALDERNIWLKPLKQGRRFSMDPFAAYPNFYQLVRRIIEGEKCNG